MHVLNRSAPRIAQTQNAVLARARLLARAMRMARPRPRHLRNTEEAHANAHTFPMTQPAGYVVDLADLHFNLVQSWTDQPTPLFTPFHYAPFLSLYHVLSISLCNDTMILFAFTVNLLFSGSIGQCKSSTNSLLPELSSSWMYKLKVSF